MRSGARSSWTWTVGGQRGVWNSVERTRLIAVHQRTHEVVEGRQQRRMRPETELDFGSQAAASLHFLPLATKDPHIGPPEAVDALTRVSNRE